MKIEGITQAKQTQQVEGHEERVTTPSPKKAAALKGVDAVELSADLEGGTAALEEQQNKLIASIRARIEAGTYEVSSRLVAEKMLSSASGI